MTNSDLNRRARLSFLLSLILHTAMALVLGLILLESPQEEAAEFVAVDMLRAAKHVTPPRKMETRESIPDFRMSKREIAKMRFKPQELNPIDVDLSSQSRSSDVADAMNILPELTTDTKGLKSRFDMPLPKPTGANITKPGASARRPASGRSGAGLVGLQSGAGIFETALYRISRSIVDKNRTGKEDIVLLIDASGSMEENIAAVARYIGNMIDVFKESDLDYTLGVVKFNRLDKDNLITVYKQTADANQIKKILRSIKCDGDERTLDAIEVGLTQVEFRHTVDKTFILVTDEAFTPRTSTRQTRKGVTLGEMLRDDFREMVEMCQNDSVKVNVLGIEDGMHKSLAKETGGLWFQIPKQDGLL